jgi:hypothetical protein
MPSATPSPPSRRRRRILWLSLGVLGVLALAVIAWTGVRALMVDSELHAAAAAGRELKTQLAVADLAAADESAATLARHAQAAAALSADPVWRALEAVPVLGANLSAVRTISAELADVSEGVVTPGLGVASGLSSVWTPSGLDLDALTSAAERLDRAAAIVKEVRRQVSSMDDWALLGPVQAGVERFDHYLADAQPMIEAAAGAAHAVPAVLGADGPRSILLMMQNGAELRTGGGLTGSFAELRADNGRLKVVDQASSLDFPKLEAPITELPASVTSLFDDTIGRYVMNISSPADFQVSAALASEWWKLRSGHRPDTIVSVDVKVLAALLAVTGPVDVGAGTKLTSENLVDQLLVEPYMRLDQLQQDDLFHNAVEAVFARALSSGLDAGTLVRELSGPIAEGRISIWSADPDVQSLVSTGPFAGAHARQVDAGEDAYAVYFNDATGAKMDSFLKVGIDTTVGACRADDLRDMTISVTLTNRAPADAGSTFPVSMTGGGAFGVAPGSIGTLVAVSAPPGTFVGGVTQNDGHVPSISGDIGGYPVTQTRVLLSPGQSRSVDFHFVTASPGDFHPTILHTPLLLTPELTTATDRCS